MMPPSFQEAMTMDQIARGLTFKALHTRPGTFVIPNPWDVGSARLLAMLGFEALATTSSGQAFTIGKPDGVGAVSRAEALSSITPIVAATNLPVSADLENGFGDTPEVCAETIRLAAKIGLVGGSIEDSTGRSEAPIYPFELAVERVKAAVLAAHTQSFPFLLTARAENYLHGRNDLSDTLRRLEAFAAAGADVLFAPGLKTKEEIQAAVKAVAPKPINVIMGLVGQSMTVAELTDLGVKRISLGSSLARAAYGAFLRAAKEVKQDGTFNFAKEAVPFAEINGMFKK